MSLSWESRLEAARKARTEAPGESGPAASRDLPLPENVTWHRVSLVTPVLEGWKIVTGVLAFVTVQNLDDLVRAYRFISEHGFTLGGGIGYYLLGQQQPLPFFPRTSLAAAKACTAEDLAAQRLPEKALTAARGKYRDSRDYPGQNQDPEVAQVYGRDEDEPINSPLFARLVLELFAPLYLRLAAEEGTGKKAG